MVSNQRHRCTSVALWVLTLLLSSCPFNALKITPHAPLTRSYRSFPIRPSIENNQTLRRQRISTPKQGSRLFSTPSNDPNDGSQKSNPLQKLNRLLIAIYRFLLEAPSKIKAIYNRLSKKARIILSLQLIFFTSMLGYGVKSSLNRKVVKPVEVPYSTFLDLVEVNGKVSS